MSISISIKEPIKPEPLKVELQKPAQRPDFNFELTSSLHKLSQFENDVGYITLADVPEVEIPKDISDFNNDVGYITLSEVPKVDISNLATKQELNQKQDAISDLDTIRTNASSAVQPSSLNSYATIDFVNDTVGNIETILHNINSGA
jgi:hypothetical protein